MCSYYMCVHACIVEINNANKIVSYVFACWHVNLNELMFVRTDSKLSLFRSFVGLFLFVFLICTYVRILVRLFVCSYICVFDLYVSMLVPYDSKILFRLFVRLVRIKDVR